MGKTIRRFDRDDEFHDVRWEKEKSTLLREKRVHRREIDEPKVEEVTFKKPSYRGK